MNILTKAIDFYPSGLVVVDSDGVIVEVNQVLADIFEYSKVELQGAKIDKMFFSLVDPNELQSFLMVDNDKKSDVFRNLVSLKSSGSKIHIEVNINSFVSDNISYKILRITDTTQNYNMERLLERTQEVAKIGSWQLDLKNNKCIWSKITYQIHELDESSEVFVEDGINYYSVDHQPVIRELVEKGITQRKPWNAELKIVTTSGVEKWVRAIGAPVIDNDEVIGLEGTFQDIHEQKVLQIESELLLSKLKETESDMRSLAERHSLALDASKVGIWDWNLEKNELIWDNQMYEIYGVEKESFEGAYVAWENGLHPDDKETAAKEVQTAIDSKMKLDTEFRIIWPDKSIRYIRALATVDFDEKKNPVRLIGANWDITAEKEIEEQLRKSNSSLEQANDELMQFSYRSSHDLKAPLIAMRGLADVILEDIEENMIDEVKKNIHSIKEQASILETLVQDLLDLAKADIRDDNTDEIKFDELVSEVFSLNKTMAQANSVKMTSNIEVSGDWRFPRARVLQILNNLISNSIKYCNADKKEMFVNISIMEIDNFLEIKVSDNGIGIPYKDKDEVFQMFKRYHSQGVSGSGIGMYVLKKHVDAIDGEVDLESSSDGTVFTVNLGKKQ